MNGGRTVTVRHRRELIDGLPKGDGRATTDEAGDEIDRVRNDVKLAKARGNGTRIAALEMFNRFLSAAAEIGPEWALNLEHRANENAKRVEIAAAELRAAINEACYIDGLREWINRGCRPDVAGFSGPTPEHWLAAHTSYTHDQLAEVISRVHAAIAARKPAPEVEAGEDQAAA